MNARKIILAGGTGFIGQVLINHWKDKPVDLVILTRKPPVSYDAFTTWRGMVKRLVIGLANWTKPTCSSI